MFKSLHVPIIVVACVFLYSGCAVKPPGKYEEHITNYDTPNLTKSQVYGKAHQWFSTYFVNDKSVIEYENSNSGVIVGSGAVYIGGLLVVRNAKYKIRIEAKDNKFISSTQVLEYFDTDIKGDFVQNEVTQVQINKAHKNVSEVATSLAKYINENTVSGEH